MKNKFKIFLLFAAAITSFYFYESVSAANFSVDGSVWSTETITPDPVNGSPTARRGHSAVYSNYNGRNEMIIFGGWNGTSNLNDVWVLDMDANTWTKINMTIGDPPDPNPSPETCYDEDDNVVPCEPADPLPAFGPAKRLQHTAIYDSALDTMIIFGGGQQSGVLFKDLWFLRNLHTTPEWRKGTSAPTSTGGGLTSATAVMDTVTKEMIVFGGLLSNGTITGDTMVFDYDDSSDNNSNNGYNTWRSIAGVAGTARYEHSAVYDGINMIVFGGGNLTARKNDVWVLENVSLTSGPWRNTRLDGNPIGDPPDRPTKRSRMKAFYDSINNQMLIYGGRQTGGSEPEPRDFWVLNNANGNSPTWAQIHPTDENATMGIYDFDGSYNNSDKIMVFGGKGDSPTGYRLWNSVKKLQFDTPPTPPIIDSIISFCAGNSDPGNTINFIDNSTNETGFNVYRKTTSFGNSQVIDPADWVVGYFFNSLGTGNVIPVTDPTPATGTGYYYRVVATTDTARVGIGPEFYFGSTNNCGPTVASVTITDPAYNNSILTGIISGGTNWDVSTNPTTLQYRFLKTGVEQQGWSADDTYTCLPVNCGIGDTITVEGRAYDGISYSSVVTDSVVISNRVPTVNAGVDKSVVVSGTRNFDDATASNPDLDGDAVTFSWSCTQGTLSSSIALNPTYNASSIPGNPTCTLTASDGRVGGTASDSLTIAVTSAVNLPPTADARVSLVATPNTHPTSDNESVTINEGSSISLWGQDSSDTDGTITDTESLGPPYNPPFGYYWLCTGGTLITWHNTEQDSIAKNPVYTAPIVAEQTSYTCSLTVTDDDNATSIADTVTITVNDVPANAPIVDLEGHATPGSGTYSDGPISITLNERVYLSWTVSDADSCVGSGGSGGWNSPKSETGGTQSINNVDEDTTFTLSCTGAGITVTDSFSVRILGVVLSAIPNSGVSPVNDVDLMATVTGTVAGATYRYFFDCTDDGTAEDDTGDISVNPKTSIDLCNYTNQETASVTVWHSEGDATATIDITMLGIGAPVAVAGITTEAPNASTSFGSSITVTEGVSTTFYMAAWQGTESSPTSQSDDPDGWSNANGMHQPGPGGDATCKWDKEMHENLGDFFTGPGGGNHSTITDPNNFSICSQFAIGQKYFTVTKTFTTPGTFDFYVLRLTDLSGEESNIATVRIIVTDDPCLPDDIDPPSAFNLLSPADGSGGHGVSVALDWEDSTDLNNCSSITYDVYVEQNDSTPDIVAGAGVAVSAYTFGASQQCNVSTTYYWQVVAKDAVGNTRTSSAIWRFDVNPLSSDFSIWATPSTQTTNPQDPYKVYNIYVSPQCDYNSSVTVRTSSVSSINPIGRAGLDGKFSADGTNFSLNEITLNSPYLLPGYFGLRDTNVDDARGTTFTVTLTGNFIRNTSVSLYINKRPNARFATVANSPVPGDVDDPPSGVNPLTVAIGDSGSNGGEISGAGSSLKLFIADLNDDSTIDRCYYVDDFPNGSGCNSIWPGSGGDGSIPGRTPDPRTTPWGNVYNYDSIITYGVFDDLLLSTSDGLKSYSLSDNIPAGEIQPPSKLVTIVNAPPVAIAGISRPTINEIDFGIWDQFDFKPAIDVVLDEPTDIYLSAWQGVVGSPSSKSLDLNGVDASKWQHDVFGMAEDPVGGPNTPGLSSYCYWDTDFVVGGPDTTNANPENFAKCSYEDKNNSGSYDPGEEYIERNKTFSQIGNSYYNVLVIADRAVQNSVAAGVWVNARPRLTVSATGSGNGVVTSAPGGIDCSTLEHVPGPIFDCTEVYQSGDNIILTATFDPPDAQGAVSEFSHWEGDAAAVCGNISPCTLTMDANKTAIAVFTKPSLTITPPSTVLRVNQTLQFRTVYDPDGECGSCNDPPQDVTAASMWTILSFASIPNGLNVIEFPIGSSGLVKALNRGSATIRAEYSGVTTVIDPRIKVIRYKWQEK